MKDPIEYLGFDDEELKPKVGRPKLANKKQKRNSLIIATFSFLVALVLIIFGYGTLFGFKTINLQGSAYQNDTTGQNIRISSIKPLFKNITLKVGTARKLYVTITPSDASLKDLDYSSSDTEVASVDETGKVSALKEGNAIITVTTKDGSNKKTSFNIIVVRNADGECSFSKLTKTSTGVDYQVECNNAKIKNIYYKINGNEYSKLLTTKKYDSVPLSEEQRKQNITFKVVYYPNNSNVSKYKTKSIVTKTTTTKKINGECTLDIPSITINSAKYKINCSNATVTNIAYKIGNGSYVGLDKSNLADTVIFEESDNTRIIYFKVDYQIDGTKNVNSVTKNSVIQKNINVVR